MILFCSFSKTMHENSPKVLRHLVYPSLNINDTCQTKTALDHQLQLRSLSHRAMSDETPSHPQEARDTICKEKRRRRKHFSGARTSDEHTRDFSLNWKCEFKTHTVHLGDGVFPRQIFNGTCGCKCYFEHYTCQPIYTQISLLKFDSCSVVPLRGSTSVYEDRWIETSVTIVTGCQCVWRYRWNYTDFINVRVLTNSVKYLNLLIASPLM